MVFQVLQDSDLDSKHKIEVIKVGDYTKKKVPKKQTEEEQKKEDKFEISSDECVIHEDELQKQQKMLDGKDGKKRKDKESVETKSVESPSLEKR